MQSRPRAPESTGRSQRGHSADGSETMPIRDPNDSVRRAARNSPWLVMSALAHLILLVVLGLVVIRHHGTDKPKDAGLILVSHRAPEAPAEPIELPKPIPRWTIPEDVPGELVDETTLLFPIDTPVPEDVDLSKEIGDPTSLDGLPDGGPSSSTAIGVGLTGGPGTGVTGIFKLRPNPGPVGSGNVRPPLGPTVQIDKAVRLGLIWLCRHQNPDGSWSPRSMKDRCDPKVPCFDPKLAANDHYDEGLTSLALLCFLGAGFSHQSKLDLVDPVREERHRIGEVVKKGLEWLKKRQNPDGSFTRDRAFMYNEALATMALSEAYGLTRARYWKEPAQRGVTFLENAQRPDPHGSGRWGWRYASRTDVEDVSRGTADPEYEKSLYDSDTSVTTWCVMALKSALLSGLQVEKESLAGAVEFCRYATAGDGLVGYLDSKSAGATVSGPFDGSFLYHPTTMSALGMCIRIFATHDPNDPFLDLAAKRIVQDKPAVSKDRSSIDYYYWYYGSLALNQLDGPDSPRKNSGKYWKPWNEAMVESVVSLQEQSEHGCASGGWTASDRWGSASGAGPLYDTAMNVLTLEVYYRYANAFTGHERAGARTAPAKDAKKTEDKPAEKPAKEDGKGN
jgi:hypothetical protein